MATQRYVALLRGINVGGRNPVAMGDLRDALEHDGLTSVRTYIQSGNVLFGSDRPRAELETHLETLLEHRFGLKLMVVVRSHRQLRAVVDKAPAGFGQDLESTLCDAMFMRAPLTPARVMGAVQLRDGVDQAWAGPGVVYFARNSALRTKSRLSRITGTPEYRQMTIRNWSTTTRLLAMLDAEADSD